MGLRVLELQTFRERLQKRRVRLLPMLQWVSSNVWKASVAWSDRLLNRLWKRDSRWSRSTSCHSPVGPATQSS